MPAHSTSRLSSRAGLYVTSIRCVIPEYKVNLDKLIRLLMEEKQANPSNYAMIVLGEGAEWEGYEVEHYGGGSTTRGGSRADAGSTSRCPLRLSKATPKAKCLARSPWHAT